jgi:aspartate/methionine/tyrosine aminotransferase
MAFKVPWSKQHKTITGGLPLSFSNSYTELLSMPELTRTRGDHALVDAFDQHGLEYTANGGSLDLRQTIASLYSDAIGADNVLVFCGGQVALQVCAFALLTRADHAIVFTLGY